MRRPGLAVSVLIALVALLPLAACAGTRSVTVTGWGASAEGGVEEARARALADALGRAVQAAGRTAVTAETRLANDWDLASTVAAETSGVVRGYRIVEEGPDPGRGYRVKLVAQVVAAEAGEAPAGVRVLVVAREQYRGAYVPPQALATELARRLRDRGFATVSGQWRAPTVALARGGLRVDAERLKDLAEKHQAAWVLVAWAEARHSDTASSSLHSSRAVGQAHLYAADTGSLVASKAIDEVLGWGATPERAGDGALREARGPLAAAGVVLTVAAAGRR